MNANEFTFWLQGFFEVAKPTTLNKPQTAMIKEHLDLVFNKVTSKPEKVIKGGKDSLYNKLLKANKNVFTEKDIKRIGGKPAKDIPSKKYCGW